MLLTPPFDHTPLDPGYIKGYVPGIRENGGQYTHAAVWTLMAFAALGDGDKAGELVPHAESDQSRGFARRRAAIQSGALRGGGRCVRRASARGARRLDLVHRIGRMALSRGNGMDSWIPRAWNDSQHRSLHSPDMAAGTRFISAIIRRSTRSEWKIRAAFPAALPELNWTARRFQALRTFRLLTMAWSIKSSSFLADRVYFFLPFVRPPVRLCSQWNDSWNIALYSPGRDQIVRD